MVTVGFFDVSGSNALPYVEPVNAEQSNLPSWPILWQDQNDCKLSAKLRLQCPIDDVDCYKAAADLATTNSHDCALLARMHSGLPHKVFKNIPSCSGEVKLQWGGEDLYVRPFVVPDRAPLGFFHPFS
jgi:hypothetical protein